MQPQLKHRLGLPAPGLRALLPVAAAVLLLSFFPGLGPAAAAPVPLPGQADQPLTSRVQPPHNDPFAPPPPLGPPGEAAGPPPAGEQVSLTLPLSYLPASEAAKVLKEVISGRLTAEPVANALLFRGSQAEGERLGQLLQGIDRLTKQITLEARLLAVSLEDNAATGLNWAWDTVPQRGEYGPSNNLDGTGPNYGGNFKFFRDYSFRFQATLNALLAKGKAKILATPRLITLPGRQAGIFIGDHIPVQTEKHDSSGTYTSTDYIDAGIKLQYTPILSQDGSLVTASVHTEVSTPTLVSEIKNYKVTSRTADTWVRMKSGETLVIGGLIGEEEQKSWQKVPFLGDLPLLGAFFRSKRREKTRTEVMLLLTPHVTEPGQAPGIYRQEGEVAAEVEGDE